MSVAQDNPGSDDEGIAEPFDQTNGVVDGLEGESHGTADGDRRSDADGGTADGMGDDAGQGIMDAGFIVGRQQ